MQGDIPGLLLLLRVLKTASLRPRQRDPSRVTESDQGGFQTPNSAFVTGGRARHPGGGDAPLLKGGARESVEKYRSKTGRLCIRNIPWRDATLAEQMTRSIHLDGLGRDFYLVQSCALSRIYKVLRKRDFICMATELHLFGRAMCQASLWNGKTLLPPPAFFVPRLPPSQPAGCPCPNPARPWPRSLSNADPSLWTEANIPVLARDSHPC